MENPNISHLAGLRRTAVVTNTVQFSMLVSGMVSIRNYNYNPIRAQLLQHLKIFLIKLINVLKKEPSLRNYTRCITLLYKFGYKIQLPAEDREIIEKVLKDNDVVSNDYHFYMKFWVGERHVDQFYRLSCSKLIKRNKRKSSDTDPVERFLKIKAFSNPHYIATEFIEYCSKEEEKTPGEFCLYDPIRKALVLGRYSKLLSRFFVQYSQEYLEISKVS